MPTYDYKCTACSHTFEQFQSMKDKTLRKCPKCGKNALERLIGTGGAIIFKGGGFYQTDYRSDSYKKAAEAESKPTSTEAPKADSAKVDPAPKTETAPTKNAAPAPPARAERPATTNARPKKKPER